MKEHNRVAAFKTFNMTTLKKQTEMAYTDELVISKIYVIRGQKVMLDQDLAEMYGVATKVLKQAVKRNIDRFPEDFMFELTKEEFQNWRSQFVTSNSTNKMGLRYAPFAFTEQGVAMLSSVLNSSIAIQVNIQIIRVFTKMRELLLTNKEILLKLERMEKDVSQNKQDISLIFEALKQLLTQPSEKRRMIGFKTNDD
jgi:hypothetical protein